MMQDGFDVLRTDSTLGLDNMAFVGRPVQLLDDGPLGSDMCPGGAMPSVSEEQYKRLRNK